MMNTSRKLKYIAKIEAYILVDWDRKSHPGCKFVPGDKVTSPIGNGEIIAVTCAPDGKMRGITVKGNRRQHTNYYVVVGDIVKGYDSCYLSLQR